VLAHPLGHQAASAADAALAAGWRPITSRAGGAILARCSFCACGHNNGTAPPP
jgi:hypothetical protein